MLWVGNLFSSLLHFRCLRSFLCPSVSQSWSTPAVMVENGQPRPPNKASIKQTIRSDNFGPDSPLWISLTKSIGRAGWEGVLSGEKNRWEIDSTIWSGRMSGCAACSGGDWPWESVQSERGGPLSRLHFGSLNTIPFQPKRQPCQRYLTFLPYEGKSNSVLSFLHKNHPPVIYI